MSDLRRIRTDVVGSLLRPAAWKEARLSLEGRLISIDAFKKVEERCVRKHLRLQESAGLDVVTDGELSRLNFQDSFGLSVSGFASAGENLGMHQKRVEGGKPLQRWEIPDLAGPGTPVTHRRATVRRLKLERNVPLEEYLRVAPMASKPVSGRTASRSASITRGLRTFTGMSRNSWRTSSRSSAR